MVDMLAPPMGFMSWERFRCETNCTRFPNQCINEDLYTSIGDALVQHGYAAVGYTQVSIDDCWTNKEQGRDPTTNRLQADPDRFPHGIAWLADYLHEKGLKLGIYSDAGVKTCGGYEGSQYHEDIDAQTFAEWGVDYIKYDGCNIHDDAYHPNGGQVNTRDSFQKVYQAFGNALKQHSQQQPMAYSCSYPAYLGTNESAKPYHTMFHQDGCNTWRNYRDIDNTWESLHSIIRHWGDYWKDLQQAGEGGAFNDADMLLVGDDHRGKVLSHDQAKLQLGFWAMIASPLFIAGDIRTMPESYQQILLNQHVIAVNQDISRRQADCVLGCRGAPITNDEPPQTTSTRRKTNSAPKYRAESSDVQVWSKSLQLGESHALAFLNLQTNTTEPSIHYMHELNGAVARCVDLWSDNEEDVCAQGRGNTTEHWDIQLAGAGKIGSGNSDNTKQKDQAFVLKIQALHVAPTSHRLLRIDYFCSSPDCSTSTNPSSYSSSSPGRRLTIG